MSLVILHRTHVRAHRRAGFTLVEMLVAMTCTILLMFAITQTFQSIGEVSAKGRAAIEMSTQLRGVQHRLHKDFECLTVQVRSWPEPGAGGGYLEIHEGAQSRDNSFIGTGGDLRGDLDDIIAMTIRSNGEPFTGRIRGTLTAGSNGRYSIVNYTTEPPVYTTITSSVAEVIWFTKFEDKSGNGTYEMGEPISLYRRVILVRPDVDFPTFQQSQANTFYRDNDVSAHLVGPDMSMNYSAVTHNLIDLTQRRFRFAHSYNGDGSLVLTNGFLDGAFVLSGDRTGEDVMLSSVLAADIRVFDPDAPIRTDGTDPLIPGDPGFRAAATTIGFGAYVDLGYGEGMNGIDDNKDGQADEAAEGSYFNATEQARYVNMTNGRDDNNDSTVDEAAERAPSFALRPTRESYLSYFVYDTWSTWYEMDGVNQDSASEGMNPITDEASNGLDDDNKNGVDDVGERETSPPYPVPLRGVQIRLRVLEPETNQVRQATVIQDFIPE